MESLEGVEGNRERDRSEERDCSRDRSGSLVTSSASLPSQPPTPKKGAVGGRAKAEPTKIRPTRRCFFLVLLVLFLLATSRCKTKS